MVLGAGAPNVDDADANFDRQIEVAAEYLSKRSVASTKIRVGSVLYSPADFKGSMTSDKSKLLEQLIAYTRPASANISSGLSEANNIQNFQGNLKGGPMKIVLAYVDQPIDEASKDVIKTMVQNKIRLVVVRIGEHKDEEGDAFLKENKVAVVKDDEDSPLEVSELIDTKTQKGKCVFSRLLQRILNPYCILV